MSFRAIGVGDNVVDKYVNVGILYPGGQAVNFSVYANRLGAESAYLGVFGQDENAEYIKSVVTGLGVSLERCRTVEGENGYACVELVNGDRKFLYSNKGGVSGQKPLTLDEQDLAYLKGFDVIALSSNGHIDPEIPKMKTTGVPISYDFSVKGTDEIFGRICPDIDFSLVSCGHITEEETRALIEKLHGFGSPCVIATRGEEGSFFSDGKKVYFCEATPVDAKDTMGAGDSYLTAFLVTYLGWKKKHPGCTEGAEYDAAVQAAMKAGADFAAGNCLVDGAFGFGKAFEKQKA